MYSPTFIAIIVLTLYSYKQRPPVLSVIYESDVYPDITKVGFHSYILIAGLYSRLSLLQVSTNELLPLEPSVVVTVFYDCTAQAQLIKNTVRKGGGGSEPRSTDQVSREGQRTVIGGL